jgi:hypothetical protein
MFYFHMYLQEEYYRRCKSNVIRIVLFKQSYMCTHLAAMLNFIESTYIFGIKRVIETVFIPIYNAGMAFG